MHLILLLVPEKLSLPSTFLRTRKRTQQLGKFFELRMQLLPV